MSLNLIRVKNGSTPNEEYVSLRAKSDLNLKGYAIVDRTFDDNEQVSNEFRHIYVFPSWDVKEGDYVRLYTGKSKGNKTLETETGTIFHVFFWQSDECVWNDNGNDRASLISYKFLKMVNVPAIEKK
ncbi:hypothetical protein [Flavobacterium hercynium]|uniref:LTD domain-containing protein n=1 Tax=Flavobacterium hercynium TaxID=387094 RepID=A0A226GS15_9FLAO|nr:hypothetical protein [Flavobacterium hercynium]OXA84862.1 hypothetical protein B0A66_20455 [Flavobacterium hercynium]SMP22014.1 hypothetical protein SAMN06265346_107109 [Flavobacterium hercynium]